jgi:hypothetical protein
MANRKPKPAPQNLNPPWKPGQSGNPGGRPKKRPITEAYEQFTNETLPEDMCEKLGLKKGSTYAQGIGRVQVLKALKGDPRAIAEIADRIEGKSTQPVELAGDPDAPLAAKLVLVDAGAPEAPDRS